jgi:signal peptidase
MSNDNISTIIYIVGGVIAAFLINQGLALVLNTDMPLVAVESNSMVPTFYKGDILVLIGTEAKDLKIGDIIVFSVPSQNVPVVHRIIKINIDGSFQTKGDANSGQLSFEKNILKEQIHGKEVAIIPYLGWVKILMTEFIIPNILYVITALIIGFLGFKAIKRIW